MKHDSKIALRFVDIDAMGHVNNAVFLNYFEQARIDFFNTHIGRAWDWKNQGIVLARNEIDYYIPVLLNDDVHIESSVLEIGTKSMTMQFIVYDGQVEDKQRQFACGRCVLVAFDYSSGRTKEIPQQWRDLLEPQ